MIFLLDISALIWESPKNDHDVNTADSERSSPAPSLTFVEYINVACINENESSTTTSQTASQPGKSKGPSDISQTRAEGPCQPSLTVFPQILFGDKRRGFKKNWYDNDSWTHVVIFQCRTNQLSPHLQRMVFGIGVKLLEKMVGYPSMNDPINQHWSHGRNSS